MSNDITIINKDGLFIPDENTILEWINETLKFIQHTATITLNTFTKHDMQELNNKFRKINNPTNILAFPYTAQNNITNNTNILGDLAICPDVIISEAKQQQKHPENHFAHIIIHGVLHLAGYTHDDNQNANIMENTEREILHTFNIDDPYSEER